MDKTLLIQQYRNELLTEVLPFWEKYSLDQQYGGFFTCLLPNREIYDTDKFIWLQARQVWTFSALFNRLESRSSWLEIALHGANFLEKHGRNPEGDWYFQLNRQGQPLVKAYNIFSDCFACMAFGQLSIATKEARYADLSRSTFERILQRRDNPKGPYNKQVSGTRPLKNFALPMILCNLALEIEHLLPKELVEKTIRECIDEVMGAFLQKESGLILENVTPEGTFSDSFEGRLINPGHAIEAMWFIMDLGERLQDQPLIDEAASTLLRMLEYGWDQQYGGIFYFLDVKGYPPQQLEWDQKLWWVHLETLIALLKAWRHTQQPVYRQWFDKVHQYTWQHFRDPKNGGEWFGYLNRRGEVLLNLKGGKWKGCFHVPRALWRCLTELEAIA